MTTNLKLNTSNWFKKQLLLLGLFILAMLPLVSHAQQYPVRIIPVITPPYSLKLADYAHAPESKLQLQILMTDLQQPQHHTGIKFFLQAGLNAQPIAQSNEFIIGQKPFLLTPGANITLTSSQIKHLFDPQNINGLNPQQYANPLPEGLYQFCFQAYDFYSKNNLSDKACASIFLNQYDPPQLNIPQNAEKIQALNPYGNASGILFQWMPRQVAPNTKYNFILKEIWDTNQSPISAFLASPVLWKEETFAPNLYYSIDKTQLIPGRRYAWQVQAFSPNPFDNFNNFTNSQIQNANYKNNGLSEIFFFDYVENCQTPTFLMAKNKGRGRVEIHWNFLGNPTGLYKIQYRKKGANTPWMHTEAYQNSAFISGLEDLTEYEYRVGAVCEQPQTFSDEQSSDNAYAFSPVQFFTTDSQDVQNNNFQCGVMPAVDISNKEPLRQSLVANDTFTAGDFPVTIIEAQGSNGIFTGTGFIKVPYLADTKIKVAFQNIAINSDKKLISGTVETEYDPNESAVHFASTGLGELFGDAGIKDITLDYNVSNVQFIATPPPGKIIIIGDNGKENNDDTGSGTGSTQELPAGRDYTIVDKNGNVWQVDEDGNITSGGTLADGGKSTPENTDGVDANGSANAITAKGIKVDFENASNSKYAFDKPKKLISDDYKEISGYIIPFKAVENKETEPFIAKISITDDSVKADSLIFKTSKGVAIEAKKIDGTNDFKLTLKGTYSYDKEEIQAVIKQNGKYQIAGVFNLVHISPKTIKLNLVPTTGVKIADETIAQIKNIYSKVAINMDITTKPEFDIKDFLVNNKLPTEDEFGDLSTYSQAQNNIISKYMADNKEVGLEYYIFVTDKPSSSGQDGYMRLNGQFGFVFNQSARTIAHELAHGALKLEHPFKLFKNLNKGDTSSIMDYAEGTNFIFPEWKQINDPKLKIYSFQEQKEGEKVDGATFVLENEENFITPDGKLLSLPKGTIIYHYCLDINVNNTHSYGSYPNGALYGFKQNGKYYVFKSAFSSGGDIFDGYYLIENKNYTTTKYNIENQTIEKKDIVFLNYTAKVTEPHFVNFIKIKNFDFKHKSDNKFSYIKYQDKFSASDIIESISFPSAVCGNNEIPQKEIGEKKIKNSNRQFIASIRGKTADKKYKIDVYKNEKTGKYEVEVELTGKPFNTEIAEQKTLIQQQIKTLAEEKLNELGGLDDKKSLYQRQETEDGGEFYVKDMNGQEWLETLGDLGSSVWENAALPKSYWNKDEGYNQSNIHIPPTFAGVGDGVVEEISNYPQLVKLGYDVATQKDVREGLWNRVKNITPESIKNAAINFYEEKKNNYTSDKSYIVNHTVGKDAVAIASLFMGGGATKGLKEATNNIDDGIKKVGENIKETKAKKIFNTAQELVDDIAKNRYSIRKNIIDLPESKAYAKKYFDKFVKEGNFDDWFKNTFAKYDKSTLTFEAHHIIPIDVLKTNPDLRQLLFDLKKADPNFKFDFNGIDNGMMLQKKNLNLDINGHTSHKNYNDAISENISVIIENAPTSKKAFERIQKLIIDTKDKLEKEVLLGTKNVNDIKNF